MITIQKNIGGMTVTVQKESFKELFTTMSSLDDIFSKCPENFVFRTREIDGNTFYELVEPETRAALSLGQYKDKDKSDMLFPRRKDKDGNYLDNNGWVVWKGNKEAVSPKPTAKKSTVAAKSDIPF